MELTLVRADETDRSTPGMLFIGDTPFGVTLEPPWKNNEHDISCIPEGRYRLSIRYSTTFGREVLDVHDVPDRSAILIHNGNYPGDTKGCILIGQKALRDMVTNSRAALEVLVHMVRESKEEAWLSIRSRQSQKVSAK